MCTDKALENNSHEQKTTTATSWLELLGIFACVCKIWRNWLGFLSQQPHMFPKYFWYLRWTITQLSSWGGTSWSSFTVKIKDMKKIMYLSFPCKHLANIQILKSQPAFIYFHFSCYHTSKCQIFSSTVVKSSKRWSWAQVPQERKLIL